MIAHKSPLGFVPSSTMLDQQRPLWKDVIAIGTCFWLLFIVTGKMSSEHCQVEKALVACGTSVGIFACVLEYFMLLQLDLSTESLITLTTSVRRWIHMNCLVMSIHVAFGGKLLMAIGILAVDRCYLSLGLMTTSLVTLEMWFVGVSLIAAFDITFKCFL